MKLTTLIASLLLALSPLTAMAGHHGDMDSMKEPTKEERATMSTMHAKMAECLKTEKPMKDCHKEMMDSCPMAKEGKCPMMGMGMGPGHEHEHGGKMPKGKDKKTE